VNQIVFNITEYAEYRVERICKKKNKKMAQAGFEPRSLVWLLATLPIELRKHSVVVVYCTYLTHCHTLQLLVSDWLS